MFRTVVYIGEDAELFSRLAGQLQCEGYELQRASLPTACIEDLLSRWFRVLILDVDITTWPGLDFLRRIKQRDACVPVVVLGDDRGHSLTSIGVARQNGCERWICRSRLDPAEFGKVIGDAFRRLEHWKADLQGISERARRNELSSSLL